MKVGAAVVVIIGVVVVPGGAVVVIIGVVVVFGGAVVVIIGVVEFGVPVVVVIRVMVVVGGLDSHTVCAIDPGDSVNMRSLLAVVCTQ